MSLTPSRKPSSEQRRYCLPPFARSQCLEVDGRRILCSHVLGKERNADLSLPGARLALVEAAGDVSIVIHPVLTPVPVGLRRRRAAPQLGRTRSHPGRLQLSFCYTMTFTDLNPYFLRRQAKHAGCSDNHGIRTPTPEQYLTPLQQKEVCIRHLRARLRDNVERLQHRDCEIDGLRTQLYRMQEDWVEEECHRVEAQMALKEARKEIQHLQEVVDTVKSNLSVREQNPHDHKPHPGLQEARHGGRSRSCGCSPAGTLSRGTTRTRLSSEALHLEHGPNAPEASRAPRPAGQTHLLLDATLLSEQLPPQGHMRGPPTLPRSSTYERMCSGGESGAEVLSIISSATADSTPSEPHPFPSSLPGASPAEHSCRVAPLPPVEPQGATRTPMEPRTCQPPSAAPLPERRDAVVVEIDEDDGDGTEDGFPPQLCHWSRYFLVDLLALAVPVVPTMAWLCRGATREVMPVYQFGSLLRGCCAVALHSLRRRGASRGRGPASVSGSTPI
uniref:Syntaphilin a n=1 Tax=Gasterosteus aculeatus aculeatus TaxID=481459 RepID=A0AAQ4S5P8_GASAC